MVARPSSTEHLSNQNCPADLDDLAAELDALDARVDAAERRIADALRPEPVDWEAQYRELFWPLMTAAGYDVAASEGQG